MNVHEREPVWKASQGDKASSELHTLGLSAEPFGAEPPSRANPPVLMILWGMVGAAMLIVGIRAYDEWRARVAFEEISRPGLDVLRQAHTETLRAQRAAAEKEAQREANLRLKEAQRVDAIVQRQRAEEELKRAAAAAVDRKEGAWVAGVNYLDRPATTILAGWKRGMISL